MEPAPAARAHFPPSLFDVTSNTQPLLLSLYAYLAASSFLLTMDPSSPFGDFDFWASFSDFSADFERFFEFGPAFHTSFSNFGGSVSVMFDDTSVPLGSLFDGGG